MQIVWKRQNYQVVTGTVGKHEVCYIYQDKMGQHGTLYLIPVKRCDCKTLTAAKKWAQEETTRWFKDAGVKNEKD